MAARGAFEQPARIPALFLTLRRNVEYWSTQPLLGAGARLSFPGSELVFQYYPGHGLQIQWLGTFGKLNGYWSGGKRYDARAGALLDEAMPLATERAGGLAWEYLFPFDGQDAAVGLLAGPGHGPAGDGALGHQAPAPGGGLPDRAARARDLPDRPARGRARASPATAPTTCSTRALPRLFVLNGFIQSLVGLYDFAAADRGRDRARALRRRRPRRQAGGPDLRHRRLVAVLARVDQKESDLGYHKLLRDFLAQLCKRTATRAVLQRQPALHRVPDDAAGASRCCRARWSPRSPGKLRFKLSKISRISVTDHAGDAGDRDDQPGRALPRDQDAGLDGAEEDRRLRR